MATSPRLGITYVDSNQANPDVVANEFINKFEMLVGRSVQDRDLSTPPASPTNGDMYIPKATATGAWLGLENHLVGYYDGWLDIDPSAFTVSPSVYIEDEGICVRWDGTSWKSDLGEAMIALREAGGGQVFTTNAETSWDNEDRKDSGVFTFTATGTDITVLEAGDYEVEYNMTFDFSTTGLTEVQVQVAKNGSAEAASSSFCTNGATTLKQTISGKYLLVGLAANDVISIMAQRVSGTASVTNVGGACRLYIRKV